MNKVSIRVFALALVAALLCPPATATGPIGEHVNHLKDNLNSYTDEVQWLTTKVDALIANYEKQGAEATDTDQLMEYWEAVDFHAAIETTYVPVYASIWQGLYGVKQSIDKQQPLAAVRAEQAKLEQALWQALGAVKLAAQFQERGLLAEVETSENSATTPVETLDEIKMRLDRVLAKHAEQLQEEATDIVHDTYLNLFEGVEGELIALDAELVEDLEKDFNVTLPQALERGDSVDKVRAVVVAMQNKLSRAQSLLAEAEKSSKDVF